MNRPSPSRPPRRIGHWSTAVVGGGALYFLIVFSVGFILGVLRTLWLVPRIGVRWAELLEIPVMLVVIYWAARWVSRWSRLYDHSRPVQAGVGLVGLLLLVGAELGLALQLSGQSPAEYVASRDPVSSTAYALSLVLFAVMPTLVTRNSNLTSGDAGKVPPLFHGRARDRTVPLARRLHDRDGPFMTGKSPS